MAGPRPKKACIGGCGKQLGHCAYYMVHNPIWAEAGATEGLMCLGCLSARLGRKLTVADFTDAPVNIAIMDVLFNVEPPGEAEPVPVFKLPIRGGRRKS